MPWFRSRRNRAAMSASDVVMMPPSPVDTFFVAQLGTIPLAAISYTFPIVLVLGSITFGLGTGATSVVSRATH